MNTRMNLQTREVWLTSIEIAAEEVASKVGWKTVFFVLINYGANTIDEISDTKLPDVFNELQLLAEGDIY